MEIRQNKGTFNIVVILNILAAIMVVFAIFNIYTSNKYISDLVVQGFKPREEIIEVIKFYLNAVTPYVFYAVSLYVLGSIVKKVDAILDRENKVIKYNGNKVGQRSVDSIEAEEDIVDILLKENSK